MGRETRTCSTLFCLNFALVLSSLRFFKTHQDMLRSSGLSSQTYMVMMCTGGGEQKAPTSTQLPPFHNSAVVAAAYKLVGYFGTRRPFYLSRPHSGSSCTFSNPHHKTSQNSGTMLIIFCHMLISLGLPQLRLQHSV